MVAAIRKVWAMLIPAKTRNKLAIDTHITAEKAKKVVRAEAVVIRSIRNEKSITNASGASIATHLSGVPKMAATKAGVLATP